MNDFEQALIDKVLEGVHGLALKLTEAIGELRGDIRENRTEAHREREALRELVKGNIETDTRRLNSHAEALDSQRERLARLEEWKEEYKRQATNRLLLSNSVTVVVAVVITYFLSKL